MSELQGLQSRFEDLRSMGYRVIAISPDSVESNNRVARRLALEYAVATDEGLALTKALGLVHPGGAPAGHDVPRPATYVIRDNEIVWEYLTDNWRVRPHPDEVVAAAEAAL